MTYTGFENYTLAEIVRQVEHEGASRAVVELLKRIEDLQTEKKESDELAETLEAQHEALKEEHKALQSKYESLNELLEGEPA